MEAWAPILQKIMPVMHLAFLFLPSKNTSSTWNQPKAGQLKFQTYSNSANKLMVVQQAF